MKRFANILFLADRVDGLDAALQRASALSQSNGARLTVMDVTPDTGLADYFRRTYGLDLDAQLREQRMRELEALTRPLADAGIPVYTKVVSGTPFIETVRAVQRNGYDLVIKAAQNDSGRSPALFGSSDMHLLRKCPCPVWIDRPAGASYRRIVAAVDPFDDESGDLPHLILDLATSLAAREQAELDIVHAWELPGESMLTNGRGRVPRDEFALLLEHREKHHRDALDRLLADYGMDAGSANVHLVKGRPARVISAHVDQRQADLIVMGTLGRAGIPGLFIGNTAEDVLRETRSAVLAVKPAGFVSPVAA